MATALSDILKRTNELLKFTDTVNLTTADRRDLIVRAVREYSVRRPYWGITAQTAGSDNWYSLPSDYEDGFSFMHEIEYPVGNTPPDTIDDDNWFIDTMIVSSTAVKRLRFVSNSPTNGEIFWMKYTKRHTFDSSDNSTVPDCDELGIAYLCCSLFCAALADHYAGRSDGNLTEVEIPGMTTRKDEYQSMAQTWWTKYDKSLPQLEDGAEGYINFSQDMYFDRDEE